MGEVEEEILERGNWGSKMDFLLSCIGYAVGLGNVWRFPYLAYSDGGATFLIPYIIMLVLAGLPLFYMELALGQFSSEGPITVWKVSPIFTGVGFAMVWVSATVSVYYNVIITWSIYYMFVSFVSLDDKLPWQTCNNTFNTEHCRIEPYPNVLTMNESFAKNAIWGEMYKQDCVVKKLDNVTTVFNLTDVTDINSTIAVHGDFKTGFKSCAYVYRTSSEEYFNNFVLRMDKSTGMTDAGMVSVKNVLTLLVAWILIFACLMKGVKSSGKVVYFTATFPYVVLVILLIRGLTLPGFMIGINFYVIPKWEKLGDFKVWGHAATQIFYSLGPGFGGLLTMSSYNKFKNNCYTDSILVALINCGTSIFAGFAIFSLLGFMAERTNQDIENVVDQGTGLAFIAYPEGIAQLPAAPVFAFLFFFMLLTLGLDSQFAMMETVISAFTDMFPRLLRKHKSFFTLFCCLIGFFLGIPLVTEGGIYVFNLMNAYTGSFQLILISFAELVAVMWVYGINNFCRDIEMMIGYQPNIYWKAMWFAITPAVIVFIVASSAIGYARLTYGSYTYPDYGEAIGWLFIAIPLFMILATAIYKVCRLGFRKALKPLPTWGPAMPEDRTGVYAAVNYGYQDESGDLPFTVNSKDPISPDDVKPHYISEKL